ncbi:MAG: prefoldin subunit [Nanoarchaeota archaeon]|nr:prefoldin subunit [Nanoarchaeota archaeon]
MNQEKIQELQFLEQGMQNLSHQKQRFETELVEIENALNEVSKTSSKPYKVVNGVMFATSPEDLKKELSSKKEIISIRVKNIDKQEQEIRKKAESLQKEVLKELKK